ncbi:MAG: galactokinase [Clostridium sp.]|nr:galactokinase [Clostridium sp.]
MNINQLKENLQSGAFNERFLKLYNADEASIAKINRRYLNLVSGFENIFGQYNEVFLFSSPGRTEIGGNHTDHQRGCVLAGSVNLDVIAAVALNGTNKIRIQSKGYAIDEIDLGELEPDSSEYNQAKALIRGVAADFQKLGFEIKGFDAYTESNVLKGSGLSSSAAFEVLVGNILNGLFCSGNVDSVQIAKTGQYAENVYFGKPCGLMDQMASSVGGIVSIDFKDVKNPVIKKIAFDFASTGYALCIIDSGADHADLTEEYAAIPEEMKAVARMFGKDCLREVDKDTFLESISDVRKKNGDRAVLRALHFFNENERAQKEAAALEKGKFSDFLGLVKESGESSFMYLQNVSVCASIKEQAVAYTLALCGEFLKGRGAFRVHGGGFAGTVQAFVPLDMLIEFKEKIEHALGEGQCHILSVRPQGGIQIA